jgi:hypothetical protein
MAHIKDIYIEGVPVSYSRGGNTFAYSDGRTLFRGNGTELHIVNADYEIPVTDCSLHDYHVRRGLPVHQLMKTDKSLSLLEIGAGLAEFAPAFAAVTGNPTTVVGLEDYTSIHRISSAIIKENAESKNVLQRVQSYRERASVMRDKNMVDYYEGNFYDTYERLLNGPKFDLIIAYMSVFQYPLKTKIETFEMLGQLLSLDGQIFSEYKP